MSKPLISTLKELMETGSIAFSKWPKREMEFLSHLELIGAISETPLPTGKRLEVRKIRLLESEIDSHLPGFNNELASNSRHEAVMAQKDAHRATTTYPGIGLRFLSDSGELSFNSKVVQRLVGTYSYLTILHSELEQWDINGRVVMLENIEPFLFSERVHPNHDIAIYYSGTIAEDLMIWLTKQDVEVTFCPDYDPVGMDQFRRISEHLDAELFIPDGLQKAFEKYSKRSTLEKSNNRAILSRLESSASLPDSISMVLDLIREFQGGLDQEVFYSTH